MDDSRLLTAGKVGWPVPMFTQPRVESRLEIGYMACNRFSCSAIPDALGMCVTPVTEYSTSTHLTWGVPEFENETVTEQSSGVPACSLQSSTLVTPSTRSVIVPLRQESGRKKLALSSRLPRRCSAFWSTLMVPLGLLIGSGEPGRSTPLRVPNSRART